MQEVSGSIPDSGLSFGSAPGGVDSEVLDCGESTVLLGQRALMNLGSRLGLACVTIKSGTAVRSHCKKLLPTAA